MAKRILLNALQSAFADYVVGLTEDKLKLGVWSGEIELHDLQVNESAINQLQLPVRVIHGTVQSFRVSIPWASLDRNPVQVFIDGVYLLVGPVRKEDWAADEVRNRRLMMKRNQITTTEKSMSQKSSSSSTKDLSEGELSPKDKGYVERLIQRIVDNLKISVKNVHVRYEDPGLVLTGEKGVAAVGITLDEFFVCTTDAKFQRDFVDRTRRDASALVHKLAEIGGLHMYWQYHGAESISSLESSKRESALAKSVPVGSYSVVRPESLRLMVVHNDDPKDIIGPKYGASFEMKGFHAVVGAEQIQQVFALSDSVAALRNWSVFYPYRPRKSIKEDPRAWWHYAYTCISKKPGGWKTTMKIIRSRREYVNLQVKILEGSLVGEAEKKLTSEELSRLDILEDELPIPALLMFRRMAKAQYKKSKKDEAAVETTKQPPKSNTWFGGLFGGGKKGSTKVIEVEEEEDLVLEDLLTRSIQEEAAKLERKTKSLPPIYADYHVAAELDGVLKVMGKGGIHLIDAAAAFTAGGVMKHNGDILADFGISHFVVTDCYTPSVLFPNIISIEDSNNATIVENVLVDVNGAKEKSSSAEKPYLVHATLYLSDHETRMTLKAMPLVVVYNREVVSLLLGLVKGRGAGLSSAASGAVYKQLEEARSQAQALIQRTSIINIEVDAAAPKIIVPLSSSKDIGYLHLNCGQLVAGGGTTLHGKTRADHQPMWEVSLSDISLSLPCCVGNRLHGEGKTSPHDALIEPFTIRAIINQEVEAKSIGDFSGIPQSDEDRDSANAQPITSVTASIEPRVRGVMSAKKITLLFGVIDYITEANDNTAADYKLQLHAGLSSVPESEPLSDLTPFAGFSEDSMYESTQSMESDLQIPNPFARLLTASVHIPAVELALIEDSPNTQSTQNELLHLIVGGLFLDLEQRPFDMYVQFTLSEISLDDMKRPEGSGLRRMVYSRGGKDLDSATEAHRELIRIDFAQTSDNNSSLLSKEGPLKGHESIARLRFAALTLSLNSSCLDALTPFYRALVRAPTSKNEEPRTRKSVVSGTGSAISAQNKLWTQRMQAEIVRAQQAKSMLVELSVDEVSLELIATRPATAAVLKAAILGFEVSASLKPKDEKMEVELSLASVTLVDIRKAAASNAFTTILAPKRSGVSKNDTAEISPLLSLNYVATSSNGTVDITVRNFICNLMPDPIRESLELALEVEAAVLRMVDVGPASQPPAEPRKRGSALIGNLERAFSETSDKLAAPQLHRQQTQSATVPKKNFVLAVRATLEEAMLQLVQNAANPQSRLVVLRTSLKGDFIRKETGCEGGPGSPLRDDTISVELVRLESYVDSEIPKSGKGRSRHVTQILKPFGATVLLTTLGAAGGGTLAAITLSSQLDTFEARVSYMDVMLILGFIKAAIPAVTSTEEDEDDLSDIDEGLGDEQYEAPQEDWVDVEERAQFAKMDTADVEEAKTMTSLKFELEWSRACVVLVNDYKGKGVPVVSATVSNIVASGNGFLENFIGTASLQTELHFFNSRVGRWEPLLEKWPLEARLILKEENRCQCFLKADHLLIMNVTSDFLNSMSKTYCALFSDEGAGIDYNEDTEQEALLLAAKEGVPEWQWGEETPETSIDYNEFDEIGRSSKEKSLISPPPELLENVNLSSSRNLAPAFDTSVHLLNETGLTIQVSTSDLPAGEMFIPPGSRAALPFLLSNNGAFAGERDLRGKYVRIGWGTGAEGGSKGLSEAREPLRRLPVDRPCVSVYPLISTDANSALQSIASGGPVVEEAWQNQRFDNVRRVWKGTAMPRDRPEWSTKEWDTSKGSGVQSEERRLECIRLPDPTKWEWRDEWHVDESRIGGDPDNQTDEEGWEYAIDFSHFGMVHRSRTQRELDQARRRRWIRTRAPCTMSLEDPYRPLFLSWDVSITPQGNQLVVARSTIQISNATRIRLEIVALCTAWGRNSAVLGILSPGDTLNVPILLACATHYQLRPAPENSDVEPELQYSWCAPFPVVLNHVDKERHAWATCIRGASAQNEFKVTEDVDAIHMVIHVESSASEKLAKVLVLPPVVISSALPCSLAYRAWHQVIENVEDSTKVDSRRASLKSLVGTDRTIGANLGHIVPRHKGSSYGIVAPAGSEHLLRICSGNWGGGAFLQVGLACFGWGEVTQLLPSLPSEVLQGPWRNKQFTISLPDGQGQSLDLQCNFEPLLSGVNRRRCPALHLHITAPLWFVDRTGLDLNFRFKSGRRAQLVAQPKCMLSPVPAPASCVDSPQIGDLVSRGSTIYSTGVTEVGSKLYVDRQYEFGDGSLPPHLLGCSYVCTANADRSLILGSTGAPQPPLIRFTICNAPATVYLLFDRKASSPPSWLLRSGFRLAQGEVVVSSRRKLGQLSLRVFSIYAKDVNENEVVRLGTNKVDRAETMYIPIIGSRVVRISQGCAELGRTDIASMSDELESAWITADRGLFISQRGDGEVSIGILGFSTPSESSSPECESSKFIEQPHREGEREKYVWSDMIAATAGQQGVFSVKTKRKVYELALQTENMPGRFRECTKITVIPRFCVVNLLQDGPIYLRQRGTPANPDLSIKPGCHVPWHWPDSRFEKTVEFRTDESGWSYGAIDISRVCTTALLLPAPQPGWKSRVIHIDVKLAQNPRSDEHAVLVVIWAASKMRYPMYRVRNRCTSEVRVHQVAKGERLAQLQSNATISVQPGESKELGWPCPDLAYTLAISVTKAQQMSGRQRTAELSTDGVGNWVQVEGVKGGTGIYAQVQVEEGTKVILLTDRHPGKRTSGSGEGGDLYQEAASSLAAEADNPELAFNINIKGIGISIIGPQYPPVGVNRPVRRAELFYAQASDVYVNFSQNHMRALKVLVGSVQMDNHMDAAPFPVAFSPRDISEIFGNESSSAKKEASKLPFIDFRVIAMAGIEGESGTFHYEYVALRMLDAEISQDRSSLTALIALVTPLLTSLSPASQRCAPEDSRQWLEGHTSELLARSTKEQGGYCDVELVRLNTRARREFFKAINFHPLMFTLSWLQDPVPHELEETAQLQLLAAIPTVHRSRIALTSYLVENAFGVREELLKNITRHYTAQAVMQVLKLVGSIRALGSPADLVSGVGSGAKALLYSPISANILEPGEFFRAVGGGAGAFAMAAVHGVFNTVAGVAGGVTNVAAKLSLDEEYRRKREARQVGQLTSSGGVLEGFAQGGQNLAGGFKEGFTGIFTNPAKGAKNAGVGGFFKGLGHGVVGAIVKPVVGVTDGVVSVLQGISNESDNVVAKSHLRPRRAFDCTPGTNYGILVPFSKEAAEAQELLSSKGDEDVYLGHILMEKGYLIVMGEKKLILKFMNAPRKAEKLLVRSWQEISHAEVLPRRILLFTYEGDNIELPSDKPEELLNVYTKLFSHKNVMGNPTQMSTVKEVFGSSAGVSRDSDTDINVDETSIIGTSRKPERRGSDIESLMTAINNSLESYRFGRANSSNVPYQKLNESKLIARAEESLKQVGLASWAQLDTITWELVSLWDSNHTGLNGSRCLAVIFINASSTTVQFNDIYKQDGLGWRLLEGPQCDLTSNQLMPGGAALLFAWGYTPGILKRGSVEMRVESCAFSALFSVDRSRLHLRSKEAFSCGFVEETVTEWYSKLVVIIKGTQYGSGED